MEGSTFRLPKIAHKYIQLQSDNQYSTSMDDIYCVILFDPFVPRRLLLVTPSAPSSAKDGAATPSRDDEEEGKATNPVSASAISNKFRTLLSFTIVSSDPPLPLVFLYLNALLCS
jgi:hypothetical protein